MAAAALLFDLDGTLCDSRPWYAGVFAERHGANRAVIVQRLEAGCAPVRLAAELGITRTGLLRSCVEAASELRFYAGVHETLKAIKLRGTPMAVATGLSGKFARLVIERHDLSTYFDAIVTPSRNTPAKPHPALLNQALAVMKLEPSPDIYYVGDTAQDCGAAYAAGLSFAWASYGYSTELLKADAVLREFREVGTL